jgi:hypothetical protein
MSDNDVLELTYMQDEAKHKEIMQIQRKAENISSAVFLIADTMSDESGLKTKMKDLALRLVSESSALNSSSLGENIKNIHSLESAVRNLSSLFLISSVSGLTSQMNSSVMREEIHGFHDALVSYSRSVYDQTLVLVKENTKVQTEPFIPVTDQVSSMVEPVQVKHSNGQNNGFVKTTRKDARERTILEFIKTKDSVNIKDIARNVRGCSEKTIQRELLKMVGMGLVSKTGERRWSRYSYLPAGRQV